jgi:hypothetical protein
VERAGAAKIELFSGPPVNSPMRSRRISPLGFSRIAAALLACTFAILAAVPAKDPLASEIDRWSAFVRDNKATDENWTQIKQAVEPALARATKALQDGYRWLALLRFASARSNLAAAQYVQSRPAAERSDIGAFEREWARMGKVLAVDLKPVSPSALDSVRPAAVRAIAEASLPQVRSFYEASADYARATTAQYGLFYIGNATAYRDFVAFCRTLSEPSAKKLPVLRSFEPDLDALETEILADYKPPAAIDKHSDFIGTSATLKEARELEGAGLRYGALLRYLQAAQRLGMLRAAASAPGDPVALARSISEFEGRLAANGEDDSIGRVFLQQAQLDLADPAGPAGPHGIASATVKEVFPRYLAALKPAPPAPRREQPKVTVTLVRWPYT